MRLLRKLAFIGLLIFKSAVYTAFHSKKEPFWNWLHGQMGIKDEYSFIESCYIKFLFFSAHDDDFTEEVCSVYMYFRPGISKKELPAEDLILVFEAAI